MAVEWSGLAPEVLVTIDRGRNVPLRAQLEDQLRQAIRSGRLAAGDRVPSSRALAKALSLTTRQTPPDRAARRRVISPPPRI